MFGRLSVLILFLVLRIYKIEGKSSVKSTLDLFRVLRQSKLDGCLYRKDLGKFIFDFSTDLLFSIKILLLQGVRPNPSTPGPTCRSHNPTAGRES